MTAVLPALALRMILACCADMPPPECRTIPGRAITFLEWEALSAPLSPPPTTAEMDNALREACTADDPRLRELLTGLLDRYWTVQPRLDCLATSAVHAKVLVTLRELGPSAAVREFVAATKEAASLARERGSVGSAPAYFIGVEGFKAVFRSSVPSANVPALRHDDREVVRAALMALTLAYNPDVDYSNPAQVAVRALMPEVVRLFDHEDEIVQRSSLVAARNLASSRVELAAIVKRFRTKRRSGETLLLTERIEEMSRPDFRPPKER